MTGPFLPTIDHNGVTAMRLANRPAKPLCCFRHGDEVGVIWHQAITPNRYAELSTPLGHQVQVCLVVFVTKECFHTPISTLGNVVRNSGGYYTGNSWHGNDPTARDGYRQGINTYGVPLFFLIFLPIKTGVNEVSRKKTIFLIRNHNLHHLVRALP
jgi:hypothetical protein